MRMVVTLVRRLWARLAQNCACRAGAVLTAGCGLLGAVSMTAQETNNATATTALSAQAQTGAVSADPLAAEAADAVSNAPTATDDAEFPRKFRHRAGANRSAVVVIGRDVELKEGDSAEDVVVIGGSAKIRGDVRESVVVIGGDIDVEGEVGQAAVAVLGNVRVGQGATMGEDVVAVGGSVDVADGATVHGQTHEVDFGAAGLKLQWLKKWFLHCVLKLRPLAPQVGWVWAVAAVFFIFYLLVAAVFPRPVQACVAELTQRPATTFLLGLLSILLLPLVLLILAATGIGLLVVPFVLAALALGLIIGKIAVLESLGLTIGGHLGVQALQKPLAALMLGTVIIVLLYLVPVLGLLTFGVISVWSSGVAVRAGFAGLRRETPDKPAPAPTASSAGVAAMTSAPAAEMSSSPLGATAASPQTQATMATDPATSPMPALPEVLSFPKAGFWERMGAAFLDVVLVSILGAIVGGPPQAFLVALAYFAGMWAWRGTTIGGIVLGLKLVRLDGQRITFVVALVRGLAAAFSVVVLFLGFLWITWDRDKQGWHDKIAGTVVLRLPRGTPLVCI